MCRILKERGRDMSQIISLNSHDYLPIQIVPVIASFNDDGQIRPLYVGIDGERLKVFSSRIRRSFAGQVEFYCKLIVGDTLKPVLLTYYLNECIWTIPVTDPPP